MAQLSNKLCYLKLANISLRLHGKATKPTTQLLLFSCRRTTVKEPWQLWLGVLSSGIVFPAAEDPSWLFAGPGKERTFRVRGLSFHFKFEAWHFNKQNKNGTQERSASTQTGRKRSDLLARQAGPGRRRRMYTQHRNLILHLQAEGTFRQLRVQFNCMVRAFSATNVSVKNQGLVESNRLHAMGAFCCCRTDELMPAKKDNAAESENDLTVPAGRKSFTIHGEVHSPVSSCGLRKVLGAPRQQTYSVSGWKRRHKSMQIREQLQFWSSSTLIQLELFSKTEFRFWFAESRLGKQKRGPVCKVHELICLPQREEKNSFCLYRPLLLHKSNCRFRSMGALEKVARTSGTENLLSRLWRLQQPCTVFNIDSVRQSKPSCKLVILPESINQQHSSEDSRNSFCKFDSMCGFCASLTNSVWHPCFRHAITGCMSRVIMTRKADKTRKRPKNITWEVLDSSHSEQSEVNWCTRRCLVTDTGTNDWYRWRRWLGTGHNRRILLQIFCAQCGKLNRHLACSKWKVQQTQKESRITRGCAPIWGGNRNPTISPNFSNTGLFLDHKNTVLFHCSATHSIESHCTEFCRQIAHYLAGIICTQAHSWLANPSPSKAKHFDAIGFVNWKRRVHSATCFTTNQYWNRKLKHKTRLYRFWEIAAKILMLAKCKAFAPLELFR